MDPTKHLDPSGSESASPVNTYEFKFEIESTKNTIPTREKNTDSCCKQSPHTQNVKGNLWKTQKLVY